MIYLKNDSTIEQGVYIPRTVIYTGTTGGGGGDLSNYWTSAQTKNYVDGQLDDYTPTDGFATINGQVITNGGNITIEGVEYEAGTNIEIVDGVISVTGITVPTKVSDLQNDEGYITDDALSGYAQTTAVTQQINNAVSGLASESYVDNAVSGLASETYVDSAITEATSGLAETSAVTQQINNAVSGLASEVYVDSAITEATSGLAETSAVTQQINNAVSGLASESYVDNAVSGKQDTLVSGTNIKTINNESILGSGDITVQGGGAAAVEMTQAQYDALSGNVSADTFYIITDATPIDMSDYATTGDVETLADEVDTKADKQSVTQNQGSMKFPYWNGDGVITGSDGNSFLPYYFQVNGASHYTPTSNGGFTIYAPTDAGSSGQILKSTGSGAPVWATILQALGVDFWIGSQDDYDDMASHSNTTLYIIDPDL